MVFESAIQVAPAPGWAILTIDGLVDADNVDSPGAGQFADSWKLSGAQCANQTEHALVLQCQPQVTLRLRRQMQHRHGKVLKESQSERSLIPVGRVYG